VTDLATFTTHEINGVRIVEGHGELDLGNVGDLRNAIAEGLDGTDVLVFSLEGIAYLDSSALAVLIDASRKAATQRRKLLLVAPRLAPAGRLLRIAAVDQIAPIFETVDDALATLAA